ncbi:selenocysteine-specific translation elongation factor [Ramlibacter sp. G-1-2-2]|uniref:Selenocysteine-specific elongation factor n=1 Tax=Ramlibacter agri TaxID=2728837 RepID=A0A848H817_9BURK|nr:selenocysteine-specific translation elongation factor [Ramlibacter agri]
MIVGTAGHIDHGKTALVRALTGVDTDRLPEEKRRGITIELGYASLPLADGRAIGFVDVPGHERLVHTMVAGASGIDFALLLVAADDGVMPQTLEHLAILALLDVRRGAVVITKIDRVAEGLLGQRTSQARTLLADAGRADWPVLCVSSIHGDGLDALRELLLREADLPVPPPLPGQGFRMPLDRVFTLPGTGTVVAGSIAAGSVRVGDALCLAHAPQQPLRVRSLQSHGVELQEAQAGQRCAVGLAGLAREDAQRGQVLCEPAIAQQSERLDVLLRVAPAEARALRSGTLVHLHLGTQDRMATVAVLGAAAIAVGEEGLAQLVLRGSVHAWQGDRFVLRDASAQCTFAGGRVLATAAPARYRQAPERLAFLQSQRAGDAAERFAATLAHAPHGVHGSDWLRAAGYAGWPFDPATVPGATLAAQDGWMIGRAQLDAAEAAVLGALRSFHAGAPQEIGPGLQRARRLAAPRMPEPLWDGLVAHLVRAGRVSLRNGFLHLPQHGEALRAADRVVAERALPLLAQGRYDPPWVRDIAGDTRLPEAQVRQVLARLAQTGELYQVVKDLYYAPRAVQELAGLARALDAREGVVTAASFRDATGLGRKRAIQVLEFFDRVGLLRRVGDRHLLRPDTRLWEAP